MLLKTPFLIHSHTPFARRTPFRIHWDNWLALLLSLLLAISFVLLYSASNQKSAILIKHSLHVLMSFGVFILVAQIPPYYFKKWVPFLYIGGMGLLFAVLLIGTTSKGAQRWINLNFLRFQPSELMKLIVPLTLAYYLDKKAIPLQKIPILISLLIIALPAFMIAKQPDLGTALQVVATGLGVLFFAGIAWKWILQMFGLTIGILPLVWWKLHDYQRQRVLTFLNPEQDPLGSGYHIIQSKIAIGSGGLYGKGWCQGTQAQLNFLPERTTDFIFSVLGEEFGFIGVCLLCLLYFAIILRAMLIMKRITDPFQRFVTGGIIFGFFICFFINIGMVSGLLPVVGCPLPFVSYGGTSLLTWMCAFGMIVAIYSEKRHYAGKQL